MTISETTKLVGRYLAIASPKWPLNTRRPYKNAMLTFACYASDRRLIFRHIHTDDLNRYLAWLAGEYKRGTVGQHRSALRGFFAWAHDNGHIREDPSVRAHPPTSVTATTRSEALDEAACLAIDRADFAWSQVPVRDRALVHVLLHAAVHVNEAVTLTWDDVDLEVGVLRVPTKGSRIRPVRLDGVARASLRALRTTVRGHGHLFVTQTTGAPLSEKLVYNLVVETAEALSLPRCSPKTLRLSSVQRELRAGRSLADVMRSAGYAAKNNVRRAVGTLAGSVAECEKCPGKPDLRAVNRRCTTCLGTGTLVWAPDPFLRRLTRKNAAVSMRRWSMWVRQTIEDLPELGVNDVALVRALEHGAHSVLWLANDLEDIKDMPVLGFVDPRDDGPDLLAVVQRLRAMGQEARKLAVAFEHFGWLSEGAWASLGKIGANNVLLAWAIEERREGFEPWPVARPATINP